MLSKQDELRDRIDARKHELLAKYEDLKADTAHEASEARARLKTKLDELERDLAAGWDKLTDAIRTKLTRWLDTD